MESYSSGAASTPPPCHVAADPPARFGWWHRLPWQAWACGAVAVLPIVFVGLQVATWVRNVPNWDDFDTVLDFLIALDSGTTVRGIAERLLAVNNEHRMLVSRLILASCYWVWGSINFATIAVLGNLFLLGAVGLLVRRAENTMPRLRLAAILGAAVFQLQHHENFFWGGSSIDHFFVVLAASAAFGAVLVPGRGALALGCASGFLATFSLAHGMVVWPIGVVLLATARRWRALVVWGAAAALSLAAFFAGFQINPGHRLPGFAELYRVVQYWLTIAGSSPALDNVDVAPWLGAVLVGGVAVGLWRGLQIHERLAGAVICWCLGALAMIAWGRALISDRWAPITSRYVILSSLAWALFGWVLVERAQARWGRASCWMPLVLAGLVLFNLAANDIHSAAGRVYALTAERAVRAYHRDSTFGAMGTLLYPDVARADALIREAAARGLFRLPDPGTLRLPEAETVLLRDAEEIGDAAYFIEEVNGEPPEVWVRGWAFRPEDTTRLGDIAVVFRSPDGLLAVEATPLMRPDVAAEHKRSDVNYAGFEVRMPYDRLPNGKLGIGVCFDLDGSPQYMMTASTLTIRHF